MAITNEYNDEVAFLEEDSLRFFPWALTDKK
jgi:hypothetical protein